MEKVIAVLKAHRLLNLKRLARLSPAALSDRGASQLAPLIHSAGFYNVKAARLAEFLQWLEALGGFPGLRRIPTRTLRPMLLERNGVGPETADSILLYALGRPVFVIDAYTRRILSRYGLIAGDEPYEHLRLMFEASLPHSSKLYNEYHALLVRLAKTNCRSRPACDSCPLA